ncbi:MAG: hypothetical protein WBC13_04900, partial [Dokdonella sp.]
MLVLVSAWLILPDPARAADDYELEPVLAATTLVQPALLSGPGFEVDPHVEIRGYMARFTMDTAVGRIEAESMEMLAIRVSEIPAMQALDRQGHVDSFAHAASERAMDKGEQFSRLIRH